MIYKGYQAVVEFDADDRLFFGRVINTRDVIAFDGESVDELEQSFHAAIDEYLDDCAAVGKDPDKPFSGRFNLRISPELHQIATAQAERRDVSLNSLVELALQAYLSPPPTAKNLVPFQSSRKQPATRQRAAGAVASNAKSKGTNDRKARTAALPKTKRVSKSTQKASSKSRH
jgi:predicted HicB family RNase H-like nuclease